MDIKDDTLARLTHQRIKLIDRGLRQALPKAGSKPRTIHQAMGYSLFAGGKRLRPLLCLAAAEACSPKPDSFRVALPAACALECLHTYSLIHDDLPCMDNDDLRRGKPTCHCVFGEGIAILAGDALLTLSFEFLTELQPPKRYPLQIFFKEMAHTAGSKQLIAGQAADLQAEGAKKTLQEVNFIHQQKTSALITLSLRLGAMSANATAQQLDIMTLFGSHLGLAYQIIDDILDVTKSREQLGKSSGKDLAAQKATYPAVIGIPAAWRAAKQHTLKALLALKPLRTQGARLELMAQELLEREY